jgi:hypothetical protein
MRLHYTKYNIFIVYMESKITEFTIDDMLCNEHKNIKMIAKKPLNWVIRQLGPINTDAKNNIFVEQKKCEIQDEKTNTTEITSANINNNENTSTGMNKKNDWNVD